MARKVTPAVTTAAVSIAAIDMERTLTQLPFWSSLTEHEMKTLRRSIMDTEVLIIPANVIASLKEKNLYVRCFLYELATKRFSDVLGA